MKYASLIMLVLFTALTALADKKVSELNYLGHASFATNDLLLIVDTSADETKNTKISDLDFRYFTKGTDVLGVSSGGTGLSSAPSAGSLLYSNGTSFVAVGATCTSGQVLTSNGSGVWACGTASGTITAITVGTGMTGGGSSGSVGVGVNGELQGLSALSTTGYVKRTAAGTFSTPSIDLTADITGTLPIANGGTGQTTASTAINALVPSQTGNSGKVLQTNGSVVSWQTVSGGGGVSDVTASAPLLSSGGSTPDISIPVATNVDDGYLSSTDWTTFNGKQNSLTLGNLTAPGTDGIAVTGGSGSVVGSGTSLAQHVADSTHNGYLDQTDWTTFNGKQAAGSYITALTGDVTASGPGSSAASVVKIQGVDVDATTPTTDQVLAYDGSKWIPTDAALTPPAGSNGQIQFNSTGSFGGTNDLFWDSGNARLGVLTNSPAYPLDVLGDIGLYFLHSQGDRDSVGGGNANQVGVNITPSADDNTNYTTAFSFNMNMDNANSGFKMGDSSGGGLNVINSNINWGHAGTAGNVGVFTSGGNIGDGTVVQSIQQLTGFSFAPHIFANVTMDEYTGFGAYPGFDSGSTLNNANLVILNPQYSGDVTGFANSLTISPNFGAASTTAHYHAIENGGDANTTGAITDYVNYNGYINHAAISQMNGIQFTPNNDTVSGSTELSHFSISNSTLGDNVTLIAADGSSSTVASGKTVTGLNINLTGYSSDQQKQGLTINDGSLSVSSNYDTAVLSATPGEFQNNLIGGEIHIASGHPMSGSFGFGNNIGPTFLAEDDVGADNTLGAGNSLGININGLVNQMAVTSGKTVDTVSYMTAGFGVSAASTGGTVTNMTMFKALGGLNEGGTVALTNLKGFEVNPNFNSLTATNAWGVWVGDGTVDNWFEKDVVVGGSSGLPTNSSVGVEIAGTTKSLLISRLTTTQKNALTAVDGMMVYDTDLAEFDCYSGSWAACGGGGGSGITALTGDVTASGTGSVAATLATVNSNVGTFGSASVIPSLTVNAKGLVTAVSTNAVDIDAIVPSQTGNSGKVLTTNGTNVSWISPAALSSSSFAISYTATSIVVANGAAALYDTMVFDNTGGAYDPLTGELTIPSGQDGFYSVGWTGTSVARQTRYALEVNGALVATGLYTVGASAASQGYASVYLSAGDVLKVVNETGTTEQMSAIATDNRFQVVRVGGGTVGNWATYTPSNTQGFGSITPKLIKWRQVGQNDEIEATYETGSVSPSEAQFELPNGDTSSSSLLSTNPAGSGTADVCGSLIRNAPTGANDATVLCEPGQTYVTFGISNGSSGGLTKVIASALVGSSETITIHFSVPIQGR